MHTSSVWSKLSETTALTMQQSISPYTYSLYSLQKKRRKKRKSKQPWCVQYQVLVLEGDGERGEPLQDDPTASEAWAPLTGEQERRAGAQGTLTAKCMA